jgi:hypothetical protein
MSTTNVHPHTTPTAPAEAPFPTDDHMDEAQWILDLLKSYVQDLSSTLSFPGHDVSVDIMLAADDVIFEAENFVEKIQTALDGLREKVAGEANND